MANLVFLRRKRGLDLMGYIMHLYISSTTMQGGGFIYVQLSFIANWRAIVLGIHCDTYCFIT